MKISKLTLIALPAIVRAVTTKTYVDALEIYSILETADPDVLSWVEGLQTLTDEAGIMSATNDAAYTKYSSIVYEYLSTGEHAFTNVIDDSTRSHNTSHYHASSTEFESDKGTGSTSTSGSSSSSKALANGLHAGLLASSGTVFGILAIALL